MAAIYFEALKYRLVRHYRHTTLLAPSVGGGSSGEGSRTSAGESESASDRDAGGVSHSHMCALLANCDDYRTICSAIRSLETSRCMVELEGAGWAVCGHFSSMLRSVLYGRLSYPIFGLDMNSRALIRSMHRKILEEVQQLLVQTSFGTDPAIVQAMTGTPDCFREGGFVLDLLPTNRFVKPVGTLPRVQQFLELHAGEVFRQIKSWCVLARMFASQHLCAQVVIPCLT